MGLIQGFKGMILPTGVSLSANTASIGSGVEYQLEAYIVPELASNNKIHWSASNNNVTVDENGLVTGVTDGTSVVTATTDYGGYTASCTFTVYTVHVTGVTLNESELSLNAGDTAQLEATITPDNATNKKVTRRSTDTSIATVDSNGLVTCIEDGECQIIVTTVDGSYTASCDVVPGFPKEYQQVEYIQSSGTQWIDTGVIATQSTKNQIKVRPLGVTGDVIYGYCYTNDNADYRLFNYNSQIYWDMSSYRAVGSTFAANNDYEFEIGNNYVKNVGASSNLVSSTTVSSYTSAGTIKLNRHDSGAISSNRWYYVKIWDGDTLVREMYPCYRKSDNVIGMYDKVGKQFYTNQGSGNFIKGQDIINIKDIQEVEYIQSSGTGTNTGPYIDTGIILQSGKVMKIEGEFYSLEDTTGEREVFATYGGGVNLQTGWASSMLTSGRSSITYTPNNRANNTLYHVEGTFNGGNSSRPVYMFGQNEGDNGYARHNCSIRLYYFKVRENDVLVRDFIPCYRKSDNKPGLFDRANNIFYISNRTGSGDFTTGPKIGISLDKNNISLTEVGQTYQLTVTPNPSSVGAQGYQWRSSDTTIATVSNTGLVTCVTPGECVITVTAVATGDVDTCNVRNTLHKYTPNSHTLLYLPFTEDMADYSGNNRTITNDLGEIKNELFFNDNTTNSKSGLVVANMPDVGSGFTLTFWEKKTGAYANTQQPLFRYDGGNTVHSFDAGSWIGFRLWGWDNNRTVPNNGADTRRMITFTYTGSVMALYINDTLIASTSRSFSSPGGNQTYFGWGSAYTPYQGYISELIEEDYGWTASDVGNHYNLLKSYYQ